MGQKKRPSIMAILGSDKDEGESEGSSPGELEQCAHELIEAVHARNVKDAVEAFKAMFACCEAEPHEEYGDE